jgi:pSer/pThr/pTyr-binding forkhead associated (FHA) protein
MHVARLRIVGEGMDQLVDLREKTLQIGRGRDNDIVLPDASCATRTGTTSSSICKARTARG